MIKINKTKSIPAILQSKGKETIKALCDEFDANSVGFGLAYHKTNNPFRFDFDSGIYGPKEVKDQLKLEQHYKCCFCENKDFDDIAHGDVEHYRPKAWVEKDDYNKRRVYPGYYWVAYDWTNLFYCCQICNQTHKKNFFPLTDETKRAKSHKSKLETTEYTLLLNPGKEDPSKHIQFRSEYPFPLTKKGEVSIKYYGLDRDKLAEKRRKHLADIQRNIVLTQMDISRIDSAKKAEIHALLGTTTDQQLIDIVQGAKDYVAQATKQQAAFSAMVRDNLPGLP